MNYIITIIISDDSNYLSPWGVLLWSKTRLSCLNFDPLAFEIFCLMRAIYMIQTSGLSLLLTKFQL